MPELFPGSAKVKIRYSLISRGTERRMIRNCNGWTEKELIEKDVRLGYCATGTIEALCGEDPRLKQGMRVAIYGGPYVFHGDWNIVPFSLIQPIPEGISEEEAVFMGLGAIAMHGFRVGKMQIGETCLIGGLGIIGILCSQIALSAGCRIIATDFSESRRTLLEACRKDRDCQIAHPDQAENLATVLSDGKA